MEFMWIEILAVHIEDTVPRPGAAQYGTKFHRGERRKIDVERGEEFISKGAARAIEDPSPTVPRPSIRLQINDVKHEVSEVRNG